MYFVKFNILLFTQIVLWKIVNMINLLANFANLKFYFLYASTKTSSIGTELRYIHRFYWNIMYNNKILWNG